MLLIINLFRWLFALPPLPAFPIPPEPAPPEEPQEPIGHLNGEAAVHDIPADPPPPAAPQPGQPAVRNLVRKTFIAPLAPDGSMITGTEHNVRAGENKYVELTEGLAKTATSAVAAVGELKGPCEACGKWDWRILFCTSCFRPFCELHSFVLVNARPTFVQCIEHATAAAQTFNSWASQDMGFGTRPVIVPYFVAKAFLSPQQLAEVEMSQPTKPPKPTQAQPPLQSLANQHQPQHPQQPPPEQPQA